MIFLIEIAVDHLCLRLDLPCMFIFRLDNPRVADFNRRGETFAIVVFIVAVAGDLVVVPAVSGPYQRSCRDVISDLPAGGVQPNIEAINLTLCVTHVVLRIRVGLRPPAPNIPPARRIPLSIGLLMKSLPTCSTVVVVS